MKHKQQFRAIVFEDNPSCRDVLSLILRKRGYEVISFSEPLECPLYLDPECTGPQKHAFGDFLITDQRMPRMTGLEFLESQTKRGCQGCVSNKAIISATWTTEEIDKAENLGCKVFRKPFNIDELSQWLDEREKHIPKNRKLVDFGGHP